MIIEPAAVTVAADGSQWPASFQLSSALWPLPHVKSRQAAPFYAREVQEASPSTLRKWPRNRLVPPEIKRSITPVVTSAVLPRKRCRRSRKCRLHERVAVERASAMCQAWRCLAGIGLAGYGWSDDMRSGLASGQVGVAGSKARAAMPVAICRCGGGLSLKRSVCSLSRARVVLEGRFGNGTGGVVGVGRVTLSRVLTP